jgi:hypothetical protein
VTLTPVRVTRTGWAPISTLASVAQRVTWKGSLQRTAFGQRTATTLAIQLPASAEPPSRTRIGAQRTRSYVGAACAFGATPTTRSVETSQGAASGPGFHWTLDLGRQRWPRLRPHPPPFAMKDQAEPLTPRQPSRSAWGSARWDPSRLAYGSNERSPTVLVELVRKPSDQVQSGLPRKVQETR